MLFIRAEAWQVVGATHRQLPRDDPDERPQECLPWLTMVARLRREYRMTGEEIAERLRLPRSTVASHLRRRGLGRLTALEPSEPARRYNRARAGELVHLDVKKLARFRRIGDRITGDRRGEREGAGWEFVHVAVDDASRLAYVELLLDEKRQSVTGFLIRALRWFRRLGIRVERVMTDNGLGYLSRLFRKVCRLLRLRHTVLADNASGAGG